MRRRVVVLLALLVAASGILVVVTIRVRNDPQLTPARAGAEAHLDIPYGDAERNRLDVYTPEGVGPHPTVVWFHPGGWVEGDKGATMPVWDWTERGYAIVAVNYRYARPPDTVADSIDDALAAMRFLFDHHDEWRLDPDRIGVFGFSAGGHLAAMVASSEMPVAAVATSGAPTDFAPLLDLTDTFFDGTRGADVAERARSLLGCRAETACATAAAVSSPVQSPIGASPRLVVHGERDHLVAVDHAVRYFAVLGPLGDDAELVIVPDGGHSPNVDEGGIDRFFDEHLLSR